MKAGFFTLLFLFVLTVLNAQDNFPDISGKTLENKKVSIPLATKGKYTLIGMAYSQKAEEDLKTWYQPVFDMFIHKSTNSFLPVDDYDVNIYFIPMITGIAKGASGKIEQKMKENIDKSLQPYILLYEGDIKAYKTSLKMNEKDQPYFFVLDENGQIVYACSGVYTEEKMDRITEILDEI